MNGGNENFAVANGWDARLLETIEQIRKFLSIYKFIESRILFLQVNKCGLATHLE